MGDASRFTILKAMDHEHLWRRWFREPAGWGPWQAFLSALFGLGLSEPDLALFQRCTGRASPRAGGYSEAWLVCGRRAGKSFVLALVACYLAACREWRPYLAPGEVGTIKIIATDRRQARVIHRYCRALLTEVPTLKELVVRETETEIELRNSVLLEIQAASFRSVRGYTLIAALCDEIAFWRSDETSANPDAEILAAIRPAMATIPGAMLLCASSVCPPRRAVERLSPLGWRGRRAGPGLACADPGDEPVGAAADRRRGAQSRPGKGRQRVSRRVPYRYRDFHPPRSGRRGGRSGSL